MGYIGVVVGVSGGAWEEANIVYDETESICKIVSVFR